MTISWFHLNISHFSLSNGALYSISCGFVPPLLKVYELATHKVNTELETRKYEGNVHIITNTANVSLDRFITERC